MAFLFQSISGSVTAPLGFRTSGVYCDVKRLGTGKGSNKAVDLDLALIGADQVCVVAGLFTTNQICAAPVKRCLRQIKKGVGQAIVVNSGNANACTGDRGEKDAETMAQTTAKSLGINPEHVYVASTGRIGVPMPMPNINRGIRAAAKSMAVGPTADTTAAQAIMTSDTHPKEYAVEISTPSGPIRIGGIAKGAGMIDPLMTPDGNLPKARELHATMLSFLTTDAAIAQPVLQAALSKAVEVSFNSVTVDGDMSTNDTVLILANGQAGNQEIKSTRSTLSTRALKRRSFRYAWHWPR